MTVNSQGPVSIACLRHALLCCYLLGTLALTAHASPPDGSDALLADYPKARFICDDDEGLIAIYGTRMTTSDSALDAVARWLNDYGESLGLNGFDMSNATVRNIGKGPRQVVAIPLFQDDIPILNTFARFLVLPDNTTHSVTYVGARLAPSEPAPLARLTFAQHDALRRLGKFADANQFSLRGNPNLILRIDSDGKGRRYRRAVWRIFASATNTPIPTSFSLFLDAASGEMLEPQKELHDLSADLRVLGTVSGRLSQGDLPDSALNPPEMQAVADARVYSDLGEFTHSSLDGRFSFQITPPDSSALQANLAGEWIQIVDASGPLLEETEPLDPANPLVDFILNDPPSAFETAQLNSFVHANLTRRFYRDRQPDFVELDRQIICTVNLGGGNACGAGFDSSNLSLIFTQESANCVNTAYSSVVAHEYAHFIVNRLGLPGPQGPFGEGFADSLTVLLYDNPIMGQDFNGPGTVIRDLVAANRQYPCSGVDHTCGQVLSGVWWDIKLALQNTLGELDGLEQTRQLFTDWSRITLGGNALDSAHPITAAELLSIVDDDGEFESIPLHFQEICNGFMAHNIECPTTDCNGNGFDDALDVRSGTSEDCTANGIPDECERDCNLNGSADSCDLFEGNAVDVDLNGVPDDCQHTLSVPSPDYPTIQSAIDAAQPGDTVSVTPGIFQGSGNKDLDLMGKPLLLTCAVPGECIIDCERNGRGFNLDSDETASTIVDGFTVVHGSPIREPNNGAGIYIFDSDPTIRNCTIRDCVTSQAGGGFWIRHANPTIEGCVIANNRGRAGGGLAIANGMVKIRHTTIVSNHATSGSAMSLLQGGSVNLHNSIVWDHGPDPTSGISSQGDGLQVSYSLVERGWAGPGNLRGNPLFENADLGDFRLSLNSPCINTGDPATSGMLAEDIAGNPRLQSCRVDLGAFESNLQQMTGDYNDDQRWDLADFAGFQICLSSTNTGSPDSAACECIFDELLPTGVDVADFIPLQSRLTTP